MMHKDIIERNGRLKEISQTKLKKEVANTLQKLRKQSQNPLMDRFYRRAEEIYLEDKLDFGNKKVLGTLCVHIPVEFVYALDAVPVRLCNGIYPMEQLGAEILPTKVCPMVKAIAGSLNSQAFPFKPMPSLIINPTTCDQKKKLSEAIPDLDIPFYNLELPPSKGSEASISYWNHSIADFIQELEKFTGNKLKKSKLKDAILKTNQAQAKYRRLSDYRSKGRISGSDMMLISSLFFIEDMDRWIEEVDYILNRIDKEEDSTSIRILMTGSPSIFPQIKVPIMLESMDALVVADEFCSSNRLLYDSPAIDEWHFHDMIPALADKYLKPNTCPVFVPNKDRVRKIKQLVEMNQIQGIVYQTFTGCQPYDMETNMIHRLAEELNIPFITIETAYAPDDKGQLSTRLEAFIQSIKQNECITQE
jgi:benzoyl-CoA reductase/2-hydroxyglutaryl-CoA dehydratase subunit BcrC/BadD/HgdB